MRGINSRPIPSGAVTVHPNGNLTVATASGRSYGLRADGTVASLASQGRSVNFRPDGRVAAVHTPALDIQRGVHGERIVRSVRPDHSVLVSTGRSNGFLERNVVVGNRTIIQRTYVVNGVVFSRAYVGYPFRGGVMPLFCPFRLFCSRLLRLGVLSLGDACCLWMGLGKRSLVWFLRRLLPALSRLSGASRMARRLFPLPHARRCLRSAEPSPAAARLW